MSSIKSNLSLFFILVLLSSCNYHEDKFKPSGQALTPEQRAGFGWIMDNVITPRCVECHAPGSRSPRAAKYPLRNYQEVMKEVESPSNPDNATLYLEMDGGTMPPSGRLSDDMVNAVRDWIKKGAPEKG